MNMVHAKAEHAQLQEQVARFIRCEVAPHAAAWEDTGMVPRDVLQRMGRAGWLGLTVSAEYGDGGDADVLTNLVFAEALLPSIFGDGVTEVRLKEVTKRYRTCNS